LQRKRHVRFAPNSDRVSGHEISEPKILSVGAGLQSAFITPFYFNDHGNEFASGPIFR